MLGMPADTLVWITGASSGIGAALVSTLPYNDAHVVDISRSGGAPGAEHLAADLADPSSWFAVEAHLLGRMGVADVGRAVFVHCAGTIEPIGFAGQVDSAAYRRNILLNAAAPMALGHAFLRAVASFRGTAHLVMLTSGAASTPYPGWSTYCGSKAGVDQWVRTVGEEQRLRAERGLPSCHVVAVTPGSTETAMQELIRATDPADFPAVERFRGRHERGEVRDPADAARGIWSVLDRDLPSGAVVDLKDLS